MHACSYVVSILFKRLFPHYNMLKYLGTSCVTEDSSYSASFFASFCLLIFLWTHSDSLSYVKLSSTIMLFDYFSSVEQTCNKVLFTGNSFDLLSFLEKTCEIGMSFALVISVITG